MKEIIFLVEEDIEGGFVAKALGEDIFSQTGYTENLKQRFEQHNKGIVESTKDRRPFKLIYYEACLGKDDAIRREKYFKTYHGKMCLKRRLKFYLSSDI